MISYKLVRVKSERAYPLFINKNKEIVFNEWMNAECHPTNGYSVRKGWHCCLKPVAPHLKIVLKSGELRRWVVCEVEETELYNRPESQGGVWVLAQRMKIIGWL